MSQRSLFARSAGLAIALFAVMGGATYGQAAPVAASSPTNVSVTPKSSPTSAQSALELLRGDPSVVWSDDAHTHPSFVPERLLNRIPLADLPYQPPILAQLRARLHPPSMTPQDCMIENLYPGLGPTSAGASPFSKVVAQSNLVVVGRVASFEKGYSDFHVATLVHIKVEEIMRDRDDYLRKDQDDTFAIPGGSLLIGDQQLCSIDLARKPLSVQEGERVVVLGLPLLIRSQHFITASIVFPVAVDDTLEDVGYTSVRMESGVTLPNLRTLVAKGLATASVRSPSARRWRGQVPGNEVHHEYEPAQALNDFLGR